MLSFDKAIYLSDLLRFTLSVKIKGALTALRQFLGLKSPSKMMKNAFISPKKVFFVLKIFKFLFWVMQENGLMRKLRLISKFMTSQTGKQIIIYTYSPISREVKAIRQ